VRVVSFLRSYLWRSACPSSPTRSTRSDACLSSEHSIAIADRAARARRRWPFARLPPPERGAENRRLARSTSRPSG